MTRELRRAFLATAGAFFFQGVGWSSIAVRLPEIKDKLGVSNGTLGLMLLVSVIGGWSALRPGGRWAAKYGSAPVIVATSIAGALFLPLLAWVPNIPVFVGAMFAYFFFISSMDMAMNAHGVAIEHAGATKVLGRLHATWSGGGISGGLIGGSLAAARVPLLFQGLALTVVMILATLLIRPLLLPAASDRHTPEPSASKDRVRLPSVFWILGLVGFCAALGEGAAGDWGAVLLTDEWKASAFVASLPYIAFQTTMVLGRIASDFLTARFGSRRILALCGLVLTVGLTTGLLVGDVVGVILGWLCIGLGVSVVVPITFSAAGSLARREYSHAIAPSQAVAVVSGVVYAAFLVGPPVVGLLADLVSLRWAMLVVAALGFGILAGSRVVERAEESTPTS